MGKYQDVVEAYAELIRETPAYQKYAERRDQLKADPELYQKVLEFRHENFQIQSETPEDQMMDRLEEFERKYESLRANPAVDRFLSAELAFCRMMQEVSVQVMECLDFE